MTMSSTNDLEPRDDAPAVFQATGTVEEQGERKVVRLSVPKTFQGHTFALDLVPEGTKPDPKGPFRIEYALMSEFFLHEDDLAKFDLESGRSYLRFAPELAKLKRIKLRYSTTEEPKVTREAELTFRTDGQLIQRLVIQSSEERLEAAIKHSSQLVSDLLDALTFYKRVPIQVHHVEVYSVSDQEYLRRYLTFPYTAVDVEEVDFSRAVREPHGLRPCLRLFREAISSSKPHYRLLCLYRIRELLERLQAANNKKLLRSGKSPSRPVRRIPDNDLTRRYFPSLIGKKARAFLDHVRQEYRLPVAHVSLTQSERLVLDPADVRTDHRVDYTNALLIQVVAQLIQDERSLMNTEGFD
jgi:hypothetical protein